MKFTANVRTLTALDQGAASFEAEVEAENAHGAARMAADLAAKRQYGVHGQSGFLQQQPVKSHFYVSIGVPERSPTGECLRGVTVSIRLTER